MISGTNASVLRQFQGAHILTIDGYFVSYSEPVTVWSVLAKASNETAGQGIAIGLGQTQLDASVCAMLAVGVVPALVALFAAMCALPSFLFHFCFGHILGPVSGPKAQASLALSETGDYSWVKRNSIVPPDTVEKVLGVRMEPARALQQCLFTSITGTKFVGFAVGIFQGVCLCRFLCFNVPFILLNPQSVVVGSAIGCSGVAETLCVYYGLWQAEHSALVAAGAECPTVEESLAEFPTDTALALEVVLEKHMFWKTLVPYAYPLLLILLSACSQACAVCRIPFVPSDVRVPAASSVCWDLNRNLVKMAFFCFMLHASLLARMVKAHVEAVRRSVMTVYKNDARSHSGTSGMDCERMKLLHAYVVKLSMAILPCLEAIGMPAVVAVACSCVRAALVTLNFLSSGPTQPSLIPMLLRICWELSAILCLVPLTEVSDACDGLRQQLNTLRAVSSPDDDKQIRLTESYVKNANNEQGLGFVMYGTGAVVNRRTLLTIGAKMLTLSSVAFAFAKNYIDYQHQYQAN